MWVEKDAGPVFSKMAEPRPLRWSAMGQTYCQNIPAFREGMEMSLVYFNKHSFLVFFLWWRLCCISLILRYYVMDKMVCLPNPYVKALSPRVTISGDRTFEEVMKVKWGHEGWALIQCDWCLCKKGKSDQGSLVQEKRPWKDAVRRHHQQAKHCSHLDLEIPASRTMRK